MGAEIIDDLAAEANVDDVRRIARCRSPSTAALIDDTENGWFVAITTRNWILIALGSATYAFWRSVGGGSLGRKGAAAVMGGARALGKPAIFDGDIASRDILLDLATQATDAIFSARGFAVAAQTDNPGLGLERLAKSRCPE